MSNSHDEAIEFISHYGADEFTPYAYYDKHLDCIRVRIRDCSTIETRKSRIFTLLRAAHADSELRVGFVIKGVRHLFEELNIPHDGVVKLADIMNQIIKVYPDTVVKLIREEFMQAVDSLEVEMDLDEAA